MRFLRKNDGFTLVELIVTIVVGSIATMAAATLMILGLRIYHSANDTALKQNEVNIGITVIENLLAEAKVTEATDDFIKTKERAENLVYQDGNSIKTYAGVEILDEVDDFVVTHDGDLITMEITMQDGETYAFSVYARLAEWEATDPPGNGGNDLLQEDESTSFSLSRAADAQTVLETTLVNEQLKPHVRVFLETLASQQGSTGRIRTGDGEGEYYSRWYIGSFADNPGWGSDTPWCACFVSWALDQCGGYIRGETPRYANVDTFCTDLVTSGNWKISHPKASDLIFFDWSADGDYNPEHVGVVIDADDSRVYTIEGNVNGAVVLCSYSLEDPRILGYGLIDWTK